MINPLRSPRAFDTAFLGNRRTPGQCTVTGGKAPRKIDVRRGFGLSGAVVVFTGIDISDFGLKLEFWLPEQIDEYNQKIVPLLALPPAGQYPRALLFYHPSVSDPPLNIRAVLVKEPAQLEQTADGLWTVNIKLIQYQQPKPTIAKPIAAQDDRPKPQDAADVMILQLSDQMKKLGAHK